MIYISLQGVHWAALWPNVTKSTHCTHVRMLTVTTATLATPVLLCAGLQLISAGAGDERMHTIF